MNALTLDQFRVFVTIAREGSFAEAARRMNRAQSAITYAIQKLEEQSGLTLFDRSTYRPTLTEAGKALLPRQHIRSAKLREASAQSCCGTTRNWSSAPRLTGTAGGTTGCTRPTGGDSTTFKPSTT